MKECNALFQAILSLETMEECERFFSDLCTNNELKAMAQRLEVARLVRHGHTYLDIQEESKASSASICRVKTCLNYGNGGYSLVLDRLENN